MRDFADGLEFALPMTLGIDASNLVVGGGLTHLIEFLRHARPHDFCIDRVVLYGSQSNLPWIEDRPWLVKRDVPKLGKSLFRRFLWITFGLKKRLNLDKVDVLLVPGGILTCGFQPAVTICQNLLPFEKEESSLYGISKSRLRIFLLRILFSHSFKRSAGVIFLTEYSKLRVIDEIAKTPRSYKIIPHGVSAFFSPSPARQYDISAFNTDNPFRFLYISTLDLYKNHCQVIEAISSLRNSTGWPLAIDFVGSPMPDMFRKFEETLKKFDPHSEWTKYHGWLPEERLKTFLQDADVGIFASSCENLPITLLIKMASGLPMASSDSGPMPEILGDAAIYFNPKDSTDIASKLKVLIDSPSKRKELAERSHKKSMEYQWDRCASDTLAFLSVTYRGYHRI